MEDGEIFAVGGPAEVGDFLSCEIGELGRLGAVEGLSPNVIDAVFFDDVGEGFVSRSPVQAGGAGRSGLVKNDIEIGVEMNGARSWLTRCVEIPNVDGVDVGA